MIKKKKYSLISIITVCFNSQTTIQDTLESVLNQDYNTLEYLIIDGNSTDKTLDIIKSYEQKFKEKDIIFKWISEPDNGIYDAMNKGILLSNGELIGILNSDDWYEENALDEIKNLFNKNDSLSIYVGEMNRVNKDKIPYKVNYNIKNISSAIHKNMPINHPASFVHKDVYTQIGLFNIQYKLSADYDFIFRAYNSGVSFLFTDKVIVNMRNSGATSQLENLWITAKEDHLIRKKNNVKWSYVYYVKKLIFNCLVSIRDTLRYIKNKN